jgi:hypothetical protein
MRASLSRSRPPPSCGARLPASQRSSACRRLRPAGRAVSRPGASAGAWPTRRRACPCASGPRRRPRAAAASARSARAAGGRSPQVEQHGQLARDRDDRLVVAAAGPDPLGKSQGPLPKSTGSKPIDQNGVPDCVLHRQESPVPGDPLLRRRNRDPCRMRIFMPREGAVTHLERQRDRRVGSPTVAIRLAGPNSGSSHRYN